MGVALLGLSSTLGVCGIVGASSTLAGATTPATPAPTPQQSADALAAAAAQRSLALLQSGGVNPDTDIYEAEDTPWTLFYAGCQGQAEYGNIFGTAFSKVQKNTNGTDGCELETYVVGYANGVLSEGPMVPTSSLNTWYQSLDPYTSLFEAWVVICNYSGCDGPDGGGYFYSPL
jgi:hypothetical protein